MLAKPKRRKERKNMMPDKMMECFLPSQFKVREERQLPSMAPMGRRDTAGEEIQSKVL